VQPQLAEAWGPAGTEVGIGDTQLGAKIRLMDEDKQGWTPAVSLFPIFTAPTGSMFLPVWVDKTFGKWIVDGGVGYSINP